MFCIECGQKLPEHAKFCFNCGTKVERVMEMAVREQPDEKKEIQEAAVLEKKETENRTEYKTAAGGNEEKKAEEKDTAVSLEQFIGKFDKQAKFSHCTLGGVRDDYSRFDNRANYVEYKNHIYFICYKASMERFTPKTIGIEKGLDEIFNNVFYSRVLESAFYVAERCVDDKYDRLIADSDFVEREKWREEKDIQTDRLLEGEKDMRDRKRKETEKYPKRIPADRFDQYADIMRKYADSCKAGFKDIFGELWEWVNTEEVFKKLDDCLSDTGLKKIYEADYRQALEEEERRYVVFGAVDLSTYKVEKLMEYPSSFWEGEGVHNSIGGGGGIFGKNDPVFSVSHDKMWYITYVYDNMNVNQGKHGNLAVKCLDIHTKKESVVMELPKTKEAYMPIVMGNMMAYILGRLDPYLYGDTLVYHNLSNGTVGKRKCMAVLGYDDSHVYLCMKRGSRTHSNAPYEPQEINVLNVSTGEVTGLNRFVGDVLGVKAKINRCYYIDCKNQLMYVVRDWKMARISLADKNIEYITPERNQYFDFLGSLSFDGRFSTMAFDGDFYYGSDFTLTRFDKNGGEEKIFTSGTKRFCDAHEVVGLGNGTVIAELRQGEVSLYHNGSWHVIFPDKKPTKLWGQ